MESNTDTYTKTFSIDLERANYHLKCRQRRRKRILIISVLWLVIFVYLFTPLSKVHLKVSGNVYYTKQELMNLSYINSSDYWWLVDEDKAKKVLESYKYIDNVEIKKSFFGMSLIIDEVYPVGIKNNKYVMNNRNIIEKETYDLNHKVGALVSLDDISDGELDYLIDEYSSIKLGVRNHFNKIEILKVEISDGQFYRYAKIYGEDERIGNFVIKVDLVYLNTKFNSNKYDKIIGEISKNNVKYEKSEPAMIAYHFPNEEDFSLVENFEEE